MSKKSRELFWYLRATLAGGLMLLSLAIFSSAFANQTPETKAKISDLNSSESPKGDTPAAATSSDDKAADKKVSSELEGASKPEAEMHSTGTVSKGALIISSFTVFLLAVFVGVEVINKVPPTLHTPLMSGSNAISGITVIGALLTAGHVGGGFGAMLGMVAVVLAMINVVGGYLVTHRMLMMFKKR
ncbi:MAG: NAD(P) transhydrogenase subunit alpha [Pirellulales bacterium]